ncbi:hemicentin-1 [Centroberyx affinis]|uniref:hemicentin-1 n=1 Tax=Centroberyx affinis TaxID=166261 RepID=UPI003A5C5F50
MSESTFLRLVVGFLLSATGLHASCPIELSPPSVVVRYGDYVSVNCSTSATLPDSMGWEASRGGTGLIPDVNNVTWTVERLTDWSIAPKCYINLRPDNPSEEGDQCRKILPVVLYTFPDSVAFSSSAGSAGLMNEGEMHTLTCDIQHIAPVQNLTVTWHKGSETTIKSFNNPSKEPVNQSSVLRFIASRHDDGVQFRCEAHLDLGPEGPSLSVTSPQYPVTVHFGPDISCSNISILEGETLEGRCPVAGNPSPNVIWLKDGKPTDPTVPLERDNAGWYTIKAEGRIVIDRNIWVSVLYGPELSCPVSYTAVEYATHNFTCTVEGYPRPNITFYKDGDKVDLPEKLTRSHAGQYMIIASNQLSSISHTVDIDVLYPPSKINELEDTEVEFGSTMGLKCSSMGNPRPEYLWSHYQADNVKVETEDGVSRLHIHDATANNIGSYTCYARNEIGIVSRTARVTVKGTKPECPLKITPDRMVVQYQREDLATCTPTSTISSNVKEIYWQLPQGVINGTQWFDRSHEDWDPRPVCTATFEGIGTCQKHLDFTMYKTPDSVSVQSVNHTGPMVAGTEYQVQCDIISVAPVQNLTVRWYQGNETIKSKAGTLRVTSCPPQKKTDCDNNVIRTPVDVSSTISVTLGRNQHAADFRCEARLDLGPQSPSSMSSSSLNITVYYKPVINGTKLPTTIPVFRGYPEELVCEAEGHPPPRIQWLYSSEKVVRVSGGTLIVSEAGSYTCNATNDVASSFLVVEVILKEDYLPLIAGFVAVTVVIISVIFVFIYSIYYKNTKMRRYSLKNPRLSTQNGNVAHNGWETQLPMTKLCFVVPAWAAVAPPQDRKNCHWPAWVAPPTWPVSASCPIELSTPSVVVRYGGSVSVTCSTSATEHEGMGWESTYGATGLQENVTFLIWTVKALKDWTAAPKCFFNPSAGDQCLKKLSVTIYKMPDSVSISPLSHMGPMVEGTKYHMQCDIVDVAPVKNLSVTWYKGNDIIHTQSYDGLSKTPVNESSALQFTPHRDDNGAQLFCEAQLNLGPSGPNPPMMKSKPHELTVQYLPTFVRPETETLRIAGSAKIILNCTAVGNPMPVYSWQSSHPMEEKTENQAVLASSMLHPGTYNCSASNALGTRTKQFIIAESPRNRTTFSAIVGVSVALGVLLFIAGVIFVNREGTISTRKGSSPGGRTSSGISTGMKGALLFQHSSLQSCQARSSWNFLSPFSQSTAHCENMGNNFLKWIIALCQFYSVSGEGCSLVLKPSRVVVGFGEPVSVSCEAARPVRVLGWESAIGAAHTQQDMSVQWKVDSLIDWIEEPICYGVFFTAPRQCEEKLNLVLYKTPDSVSIVSVNHTGPMVEGKEYQLLCEIQNIAPVQYLTLRWYRGQTEVYNHSFSELMPSSPVQVSSILMITPTKADNGVQYRCVAELDLGPEGPHPPPAVNSEPLNASVYYPPSFLSPEPEMLDLIVGAELTLNCTAAGHPTPVYTWQSSHPIQEKMEDEAVLSSSSLLPGTYTCTASNKLGKKSKQFTIKAKSKGV